MKNLQIGTRLGLGFALVLLLLTTLTCVGVWRMHTAAALTQDMVQVNVRNERMMEEWFKVIEVNAARTTTAYKAVDAADQEAVEADMKVASTYATSLQDRLTKVIKDERSKAELARVLETRKEYTEVRSRMFKENAAGNADAARALYDTDLVSTRTAYLGSLATLSATQKRLLDETATQVAAQYRSGRTMLITLGVLAIVLGIGCAVLITRSITGPLAEAVRVASTVSSGDLTSRIVVASRDETGQLMGALKGMNEQLVKIVGQVRTGTDTIGVASREIASGNLDLSSRTEEQASSLQETASAMEELTSTVKLNADSAREANDLAIAAAGVAVKGGAVVAEVVATMGAINDSSRKIVDIISVIDGIAFQTNILALNAAVEAARAGEQGRGFAVVASEVRNLAQRSAAAAKEIKQLIGDSVARVDAGSRLVDQAGQTMQDVVASIEKVTDIMGHITSASDEQRDGIEQINLAITQMDEVTQQNAALVEEAAAAAASMEDQATRLSKVVDTFTLDHSAPAPQAKLPGRAQPRLAA